MKILIRSLSRTTTEAEIKKIFETFGSVESCNLVMDSVTGKSKGFCFVEMSDPTQAKTAIEAMDGKKVDKNKLRVKFAEDKFDHDRS